jgi:hypothetical protein
MQKFAETFRIYSFFLLPPASVSCPAPICSLCVITDPMLDWIPLQYCKMIELNCNIYGKLSRVWQSMSLAFTVQKGIGRIKFVIFHDEVRGLEKCSWTASDESFFRLDFLIG